MSEGNLDAEGRSLDKLAFLVIGAAAMSRPSGFDVRCTMGETMMSGREDAAATTQLRDRRIGIQGKGLDRGWWKEGTMRKDAQSLQSLPTSISSTVAMNQSDGVSPTPWNGPNFWSRLGQTQRSEQEFDGGSCFSAPGSMIQSQRGLVERRRHQTPDTSEV